MSMAGLREYFERHEEQAFVAKALLTTLCIVLARDLLAGLIPLLVILFPVLFLIYIRFQAAAEGVSANDLLREHITFIPVMRTEAARKKEVVPWLTYLIIFINVVIFLGLQCTEKLPPDFIKDNLLFLPYEPTVWNLALSPFSSMFLHGSPGHLWGNMTFLWMVGSVVERRVGELRFLALYLLTGLMGGFAFVLVEYLAHGEAGHALGASGAIAGIMGVFAVRCYFKSMIFPFPLLGILSLVIPLNLKVRLNSLVIIGLFFLADLSGGIGQIAGTSDSMVGHWAHLGGMISGMLAAAFYLKLGESAVEERHLEIGVKASQAAVGFGDGERSLLIALEKNPESWEAVLALARLKTRAVATAEGADLYQRALRLLLKAQPPACIEVFNEYYGKYLTGLDPELLYRISIVCRLNSDFPTMLRCLELILERPDASRELRGNALYQMGASLEVTEMDAARGYYLKYLQEYPESERAPLLMRKLGLSELPKPVPARPQPKARPAREVEDHKLVSLAPPPEAAPLCPSCGSAMKKRRAGNGPHAGKLFLVCADFPNCRTVRPAEGVAEQAASASQAHLQAAPGLQAAPALHAASVVSALPEPPSRQRIPEASRRPTRGTGRYRLVFNGQIDFNYEQAEVVLNLIALLKMERAKVESLFSGKRVVLKDDLSREQADRAKRMLDDTGALGFVEEIQEEIPESELARITCPKCGAEQDPSDVCIQCGIIFEKYAAYLEQQEQRRLAAVESEERRLNQERERYSSVWR